MKLLCCGGEVTRTDREREREAMLWCEGDDGDESSRER